MFDAYAVFTGCICKYTHAKLLLFFPLTLFAHCFWVVHVDGLDLGMYVQKQLGLASQGGLAVEWWEKDWGNCQWFYLVLEIGVPPNHPLKNLIFHYKPSIYGNTHLVSCQVGELLRFRELGSAQWGIPWVKYETAGRLRRKRLFELT